MSRILKDIRYQKGISQWSLAQKSKVHQSRISLCENELIELTKEEKERLAAALGGFSPEDIFGVEAKELPERNAVASKEKQ